jgi:4-amino-4-deoxy-L-arabinose transferase-like glycosyltransferase
MSGSDNRWQRLADHSRSIALLIAGFTLLRLLLAAALPLLPQEAYYWSWSRHLDWSYFDHPPLATYGIALTTALLGQTVFGIKAAAVLWSIGWNLLWARVVIDMYGDRRLAFWSLAALNLTVVYEAFALGPSPDGPLLFGWTGAIWAVWRLSQSGDGRWWFAAGAFVGLSWLGKYSGVLLLPVVFVYLLTSARQRHWLLRPQPYLAVGLAAAVFAPVLIWNAQHEWVSLAFQSSKRVSEMGGFNPRYFATLLATQFLVVTPYLFVVAIGALVRGARGWFGAGSDDRSRLLLLSAAIPIALFVPISFRSLVKVNWLAPAYWSLLILGVRHVLTLQDGQRRLLRGLASSAAILLIALAAFSVANLPLARDLNTWSGWQSAAERVERVTAASRAEGRDSFVFATNYRVSSLLRFYLPGQPRTYAQDVYGDPALQFDHFPLASDLRAATGILVISDPDSFETYRARLQAVFDACERVEVVPVTAFGKVARYIEIYRCTNYKGHPRMSTARARPAGDQPAAR